MSTARFARQLFEDAKLSFQYAKNATGKNETQRHLRQALLLGFSFLECQLHQVCEHMKGIQSLSVNERGALLQREVILKNGKFQLSNRTKYCRLEDRLSILYVKFDGAPLSQKAWWSEISEATLLRNSIVHPREPVELEKKAVERALLAIITCVDDLFSAVFDKGIPYKSLGLLPKE